MTFDKYDIIALNETNCIVKKLAHGIDDLMLECFHKPFIQKPIRKSGKGED